MLYRSGLMNIEMTPVQLKTIVKKIVNKTILRFSKWKAEDKQKESTLAHKGTFNAVHIPSFLWKGNLSKQRQNRSHL